MATELALIERQLTPLAPMFTELLKSTGVSAERIIRSVLISCERTPRLLDCTPGSVIQAATTGAVLGLEADGHTGQGFLVPFRDNKRGLLLAQWQTGYKGYNTLAARVGLTVDGEVVREGDGFDFELGSTAYVKHKKKLGAGTGRRIIASWAVASAPGRNPVVVVLDIDEIMAVKDRSQAAKARGGDAEFSPWNDASGPGFAAMAGKTAKRRLGRSLPLSAFIGAARIDEAHEEQGRHAFLHPDRGLVIDGEAQQLVGNAQPSPPADMLPGLAAPPSFKIRSVTGAMQSLPTIEAWRAAMQQFVEGIRSAESLERFRDINALGFEDYCREHPADVRAIIELIDRKLRG